MQSLLQKKERIKEGKMPRDGQKIRNLTLFAAASFAFAQCHALGALSPFCVAFTAGVPFSGVAACVLGGTFGYFFALEWTAALKYTCALLLTAGFRLLIDRRFRAAKGTVICPVIALSSVLTCALVMLAFDELTLSGLLSVGCESALAFFGATFFFRAFKTPVRAVGLSNLGAQDLVGLLFAGGIFLMCAAGFVVGKLAPVRIFACLLVLFATQIGGLSFGSLLGVCVGTALCIDPSYRFLLSFYAVGGLMSGVFSPLGQYVASLFFALASAAAAFVAGMNERSLWCLAEILIGCALFFLLPNKWLEAARELLKKNSLTPDDTHGRPLAAELHRAAAAVDDAADLICTAGNRLDHVVDPEIHAIFAKLQQNICYGCGFKSECWKERFADTANDILVISGVSTRRRAKTDLEQRCPRAAALTLQIEQSYTDFVGSMAAKAKVKEARGIVSDQFRAVSVFLDDLAQQVADSRVCDAGRARSLRNLLSDSGIYVDCLQYFTAPNGRISIEITMLEDALELDGRKIKKLFEGATARHFEMPEVAIMELRTTLTFEETAAFRVIFGQAQIPMAENSVCGDCIRTLTDLSGNRIALLSDGMGTGARAAVDSELTAELTEQLLRGGFDFPCAIGMVNSALLVKSTDESIATLDALKINVYTAEATLCKAGAALSFLRRGDDVVPMEAASMPLGILREVDAATSTAALTAGDLLLLVSDGVTAGDCGWINDELLAWSTNNMDDLATHIASLARLRSQADSPDDISVIAVKVTKNRV